MRNIVHAAVAATAFIAASAFAAIVVKQQPGKYTHNGVAYETAEACIEAAKSGLAADVRTCEQVNRIIIEGNCSDVPRPVPAITVEVDTNPARYTGGGVLPGEVAQPWPEYVGVVETEAGVEFTFRDRGELEGHLCPGSDTRWYFTRTTWEANGKYPACWEQRTVNEGPSCDGPDLTGYEIPEDQQNIDMKPTE